MSEVRVTSNEPRPPWWRPFARRAYDQHLAAAQRGLGALWTTEAEQRVADMHIHAMLYGHFHRNLDDNVSPCPVAATINREGETPKEDGDACPKCGMTSRPVWNSERRAYDNRGCGHWWHAEGINYSTPTRAINREGETE